MGEVVVFVIHKHSQMGMTPWKWYGFTWIKWSNINALAGLLYYINSTMQSYQNECKIKRLSVQWSYAVSSL